MTAEVAKLPEIAASGQGTGVVWTQEAGEDLNANLVRFPEGRGVGEHVNDEVDVLFLGVSGSGTLVVDGGEVPISPGWIMLVPKGASRTTRSESEDFAYLTVHRRRGPVRIGIGRGAPAASPRDA